MAMMVLANVAGNIMPVLELDALVDAELDETDTVDAPPTPPPAPPAPPALALEDIAVPPPPMPPAPALVCAPVELAVAVCPVDALELCATLDFAPPAPVAAAVAGPLAGDSPEAPHPTPAANRQRTPALTNIIVIFKGHSPRK
jgi:hypothetical protein